jgi:levanbiose-producing levanase
VLRLDEPEARSFRDPKVFWYEPGGYWVMAAVVADARVVKLFRPGVLLWQPLSEVGGLGVDGGLVEMPDLFPLPLDGDDERWVLVFDLNGGAKDGGSGARYVVGEFDGTTFRPDELGPGAWVDEGADFYAAGTWNEAPGDERVAIAWMSNWAYAAEVHTEPWRGAMTTLRRLALRTVDGRPRLVAEPVLAGERPGAGEPPEPAYERASVEVDDATEALPGDVPGTVADIEVVIEPGTATRAGVVVHRSADGSAGTRITYDPSAGTLTVDRSRSGDVGFSPRFTTVHEAEVPAEAVEDGLDLRILTDRSSVEVFAAGGAVTFSDIVLPAKGSDGIALVAEGGTASFRDVTVRARHP